MTRHFEKTGRPELDTEFHFQSGANRVAEIRALVATGNNVGVAVNEVSENGLAELASLAGLVVNVFVDSGAFGEVSFTPAPTISKPIDAAEWEKRLAKYDRLAVALRDQVYLVAPDCVAHQAETLTRLHTYGRRILGWLAAGANVIVPVQKGELSMADFTESVVWDLVEQNDDLTYRASLRSNLIWGVPMKKDATSLDELRTFVRTVRPSRIHLLGCGHKSKTYAAALQVVTEECGDECEVYSDSVRITALVGKTNGRNGGPRSITKYLAEGKGPEYAVGRAMTDELREDVARAQAAGWSDPELVPERGQLQLVA